MRASRAGAVCVFLLALLWFGARASQAWLASGYLDPVSQIGAQDEAVYTRIALELRGGTQWLVPTFLGRIAYFKPPLLFWLSRVCVDFFGLSLISLRLPSLLAGAGTCVLVWLWILETRGVWSAAVAVILIAADYYWVMLSSLNMMDASVTFFGLAALFVFRRDTRFEKRSTQWLCAALIAAAILMKSAAGITPVLAIAAYVIFRARDRWPRLLELFAITALFALPWFVYSLSVHHDWFWREHVLSELLGHSLGTRALSMPDTNVAFYALRLIRVDPLITVGGALAIVAALRTRALDGVAFAWFCTTALTLLLFGYHAATYLLPLITSLVLLVGLSIPRISAKSGAGLAVAAMVAGGGALWMNRLSLVHSPGDTISRALTSYCEMGRSNGLLLFEPNDEFYSAALPLPRVYYGFFDQGRPALRQQIDWRFLGITASAAEFEDQERWWPIFRSRMSQFGLPENLDPRATQILFPDEAAVATLVRQRPDLDFVVPFQFSAVKGDSHAVLKATPDRMFLLSTNGSRNSARKPPWACRFASF